MDVPVTADGPVTTEVAALLSQIGGVVLSVETVQTTVDLVTRLAAETLPDTFGAGVTLVHAGGRRTAAASDPAVAEADALQYAVDSGPCLTAWNEQTTVRVDDLSTETRWPDWTAAAAGLNLRSVLSVPLVAAGISVGAIKVYSRERHAYDARSEEVLSLFAQQAAVLLTNMVTLADSRRLSAQLTDALGTRDLIGQAKGVLIARGARSEEAAFAMMVAASQRSNRKLHQVARELLASVLERQSVARPLA